MTRWPESSNELISNQPSNFVEKIWTGFPEDLTQFDEFQSLCENPYYEFAAKEELRVRPMPCQKIHTIRVDKNNRWKKGNKIHFRIWTGKPYRSETLLFAPVIKCVSVQKFEAIFIIPEDENELTYCDYRIDGKAISKETLVDLAFNDGFESVADFKEFFKPGFKGVLIHWTDKIY